MGRVGLGEGKKTFFPLPGPGPKGKKIFFPLPFTRPSGTGPWDDGVWKKISPLLLIISIA